MDGGYGAGDIEALVKRIEVLERLCESPAYIRDLVDELEQSRSTINRAINDLEAIDFVERGEHGIEATITGRLSRDRLDTFVAELNDIRTAEAVLEPLSRETKIGTDIVAGSEAILAAEPTPYRPLERLYDDLLKADHYRAFVPTLEDPRHIRLLYEHVVTAGNPAELVVTPTVFETLKQEFPRRMAAMATEASFSVFVGPVPPFGLGLLERHSRSVSRPTATAHLVVFNESRGVNGLLVNENETALEWARTQYEIHREDAIEQTDELLDGPDGDDIAGSPSATTQSLPVALEREGFVTIDVSYFRDEPVADPATAWRAGLSVTEVHTGYAVPRKCSTRDDPSPPEADQRLTASITETLVAGGHCAVLGSPGSGKSTVCKQVACEWYNSDRGTVLYREGGRGRSFRSTDALAATVANSDGHTLVIVEDAVRPAVDPIFDAIDELGTHDDVSFLLDSRESEWYDHAERTALAELEVVLLPRIGLDDCERLVAHFERTIGKSVDVSGEQLWLMVRDDTAGSDSAGTNELLRANHRLATYADPLAEEATALEDAVASVYEDLADDDVAASVGMLANVLNVAGVEVDRGLLYAVTDSASFDAVDTAIDQLTGHVLFPRGDGNYRTVHEEWSTTFLAHLIVADGEQDAQERFGTVVSELLALADDPERRRAISTHLAVPETLAQITDNPTSWVNDVVEAVYTMGRQRPQLAPLFGDGTNDTIELPIVGSEGIVSERVVWLGQLFLAGSYYDRAERAFERVRDDTVEHAGERLLGLARVSFNRGEYDDALARCQECLSLVEDEDFGVLRARCQLRLGEVQSEQGEYGDAQPNYESSLNEFRARGLRTWEANVLHQIGNLAVKQSAFDRAQECYESTLEIRREIGDRRGAAETLTSIGNIAWKQGDFDRAAELFERSLETRRALGDRQGVAVALNHLGAIEGQRGNYDRAAAFYEDSLERRRALGNRAGEAKILHNLGLLETQRENFERAVEFYERSLELKQELGDRLMISSTLNNLGTIEGRRGRFNRVAQYHERSLEIKRSLGDRHGEAFSLYNLGHIKHRQGHFDRAAEHYEACVEIMNSLENDPGTVPSLNSLGAIAARTGAYDEARAHCERSLEIAKRVDDTDGIAGAHHCLAKVGLRMDNYDTARAEYNRALEVVESGLLALQIRLTGAEIDLACGRVDRARETTDTILTEADALGANYWVARATQQLGEIESLLDRPELAREHWIEAVDSFEELGAVHDALRTLEYLVEALALEDRESDRWHGRASDLLTGASPEVQQRHTRWAVNST